MNDLTVDELDPADRKKRDIIISAVADLFPVTRLTIKLRHEIPAQPRGTFVSTRSTSNDRPSFTDNYAVFVERTTPLEIILRVLRVDGTRNPNEPVRFDILLIP